MDGPLAPTAHASSVAPWTWCPQHPPASGPGPHGFCSCEERERRFRDILRLCSDDAPPFARVVDLQRAILDAAGGHDAAGYCSACGPDAKDRQP